MELIKIREGEYKERGAWRMQVESAGRASKLLFLKYF
jgi:hypothetical protein